ncbi:MAG: DnaA regulatory inactivator Hda [Gammaproteobacteria bacterium]|nr:DnaA regulatory inactivator Hda [Gammaproteobacteria bacterium]
MMTMQQLPLHVQLRERATFATFVTGSNVEVMAKLNHAASRSERTVLWLWGAEGSGRTHLLHAACAAAPLGSRVAYLPLRELGDTSIDFLGGAPSAELLCLDDVESILGTPAIEQALLIAYRQIEERGGRIIATACGAPGALRWGLADIGSRFGAAEVFQIRPLDETGQYEALRLRATQRGLELPDETARYLLRRFPRDMRSLGKLLDEIDVASLSAQRRLTVPFVREILGEP